MRFGDGNWMRMIDNIILWREYGCRNFPFIHPWVYIIKKRMIQISRRFEDFFSTFLSWCIYDLIDVQIQKCVKDQRHPNNSQCLSLHKSDPLCSICHLLSLLSSIVVYHHTNLVELICSYRSWSISKTLLLSYP